MMILMVCSYWWLSDCSSSMHHRREVDVAFSCWPDTHFFNGQYSTISRLLYVLPVRLKPVENQQLRGGTDFNLA
jgi:hypothetical protein